ncbi:MULTISPECIES: methionine ABC transporter ATP-binding protein [Providencia]|uniref:Cell division ATP-binding protein FtsE n=1 Tax=Providencia stuartii TaxID=588 RepID=A0AAI9MVD7_PROST|nr:MULTISPECIES: ATP-binding cassette domain-containing protein [Providencia]ELR5045106.1 ATP-binding cassette domain-containing protein [Providencia rettgeri]ELR5034167.1 ATP-binding cassette domain-containing protein [Providencia stuartii]ELR5119457.1 ATP-binding cassette domain-containing protein [Providencia stuartii]ELR5290572.1 ATP-binding cassette domain-containing protein [Providencia stuartii]ELZ5938330.1 ATP-binding cassette domain-containing protein [Providencia stuartii]
MIRFQNIQKIYQKEGHSLTALQDVNLQINEGDIFGFIGYSGAGKSSLIRLVNQLEKPTSGEVVINGQNIAHHSASEIRDHKKSIGMIFQHFNLLETKTVAQNIAMPLLLSGVSKKDIERRVDDILAYVELSDKKHQYPGQLSGGQKQRVGIARALINNPKILLCDEATSALDPQTTLSILSLLKKINREQKITILLVTHEMEVIEQVCHRVAVMEAGRIVEEGTVLEIFSNPQHPTTQKFVRTVLNEEIPERVLHNLEHQNNIYRLEFLGSSAQQPVVNELILQDKIKINILFANMKEISGVVLGSMFVQLIGDNENIHQGVEFLRQRGVAVSKGVL